MEWFILIIEICKVLVWPSLILFIIFFFRKNIIGFIDRVSILKFPGGEVSAVKQVEEQESSNTLDVAEQTLLKNSQKLDFLSLEVEKLKTKNESLTNSFQLQIENLIKEIAVKDVIIDFERTYNVIFNSQITLLESLKNISVGFSSAEIETFWYFVKKGTDPIFNNWSLETYLKLLVSRQLIEHKDGIYRITKKGIEFLTYMTNMNYQKVKPY